MQFLMTTPFSVVFRGIELNINKTEILKLNLDTLNSIFVPEHVRVNGNVLATSESVNICGVVFSNSKPLS